MSRPLHSPPPLDWQPLLLEAIERRDAPRAVPLAQRCVHRHGMNALEALLERADAVSAQSGDARSWLLAQLREGQPQSLSTEVLTPSSAAPTPSVPAAVAEFPQPDEVSVLEAERSMEADNTRAGATDAGTDCADEAVVPRQLDLTQEFGFLAPSRSPSAPEAASSNGPDPLATVAAPVEEASDTSNLAQAAEVGPAETLVSVVESGSTQAKPSFSEPAHGRASGPDHPHTPISAPASAALDLAFAPLEIAFPPLPLSAPERQEASATSVFPAPVEEIPPRTSPNSQTRIAPSQTLGLSNSAASTAEGIVAPVQGEGLSEPFAVGAAAPVPRFQVDDLPEQEPRSRRKRGPSDEPSEAPTKVAKALDAWRAWLPGAFRSRDRS